MFFHTENLATEIEVWKDMKKIKHLPAPLSQKKAMRLQYQVSCYLDTFYKKDVVDNFYIKLHVKILIRLILIYIHFTFSEMP